MKALKTGLGLTATTIAVLVFPLAAQAEYLIPPSNSAATQYTEAVPTAGGPKTSGSSKRHQAKSPGKVIGSGNVKKLDAQGPEGHAAAEVAAATAPSTIGSAPGETKATSAQHGQSQQRQGGNGGGSVSNDQVSSGSGAQATNPSSQQQDSNGSSGLGEVISQATGSSSSGDLGLLLPLIVLAALAWSVAFVVRQRRRPTE
jgi:hypothetical protein